MAILPNAPDCIQVNLVGLNQGATWVNVMHFEGEASIATVDAADLSTFNDAIAAAWTTNIAPLCNPLVSLTDVNSIILTDRDSPTFYSHDPTPPVGTNTGTALPVNMAVCISWHAQRRYRGGHPRNYLPVGNIDDIVNGRTLSSAFQTQCNSAATAYESQLQGLTVGGVALHLICLSYYHSVPDPARPGHNMSVLRDNPEPILITGAKVRTRFDSQRRRLGKELS